MTLFRAPVLRLALLVVLLTLGLSLRAVGPLPWADQRAGYAAICTGAEIIYVPLSALGYDAPPPDAGEDHATKESCPWGGQLQAALAPAGPLTIAAAPAPPPPPAPAARAPGAPTPHGFHARAPPVARG